MPIKHEIEFSSHEITVLEDILNRGKHTAEKRKRAQALLLVNDNRTDREISEITGQSISTIEKLRKRVIVNGFDATLNGLPKAGRKPILTIEDEAKVIALACQKPPDGHSRKTLRLLSGEFTTKDGKHVSYETIRKTLKKTDTKPWLKKEFCIPPVRNEEFIEGMENTLDIYSNTDSEYLLVCIDETPFQLLEEVRDEIPGKPGSPLKMDCEYKRNGTANIFVSVAPHIGKYAASVTDRRTRLDFAEEVHRLLYEVFPKEKQILLVCDNLNTHNEKSLYAKYPEKTVKKMLKRLTFHHTPVHGSWLNIAECAIGMLKRSGLKIRIGSKKELIKQVAAFIRRINKEKKIINWKFTKEDARKKMKKIYP